MGAFEFRALDTDGASRRGVLEGDTPRQIRHQLRERGWTPLTVEAVQQREARRAGGGILSRRVSTADLALLTRQLATLVGSGTPLEEALRATAQQTHGRYLHSTLLAVRARITEGHTLAEALTEFPRVFPELYRATVAAGEQSGHLDTVLSRLADFTENRQQLGQHVTLALIYPALLTAVALGVVAFLLGFVVPEVTRVFRDIGQQLPLLTRILIAASDFIRDYGAVLFVACALGWFGWRRLRTRPGIQQRTDRFKLTLPLAGRLIRGINAARFARTFSILTASGVPVLEGLRISAQVLPNLPMREAVLAAAARVREGTSLHLALDHSGYFPPLTIHLIASGEASGKLEEMLERAASQQESEMETLISALIRVFEPLLIFTMALLVLFIVLAILLPIFDLNQLVR